jgi:hypothetical protein
VDPDNDNVVLYADKTALHWSRLTKKEGDFSIIVIGLKYNEDDPENHWNTKSWSICNILIRELSHYYKINTNQDVVIETEYGIDGKDSDDDIDDNST